MNEILPSSEILKKNTEWKTTIFFTKKSLYHILDQHSESNDVKKLNKSEKSIFVINKKLKI